MTNEDKNPIRNREASKRASISNGTRLISALLITLIIVPAVLFSAPKKVQAQWYTLDGSNLIANIFTGSEQGIETGHTITNALAEILKQTIMVIERRLLQELTKGITGWINTGFHGSPLFLTNSDSFFHDIAKTEIKTIVSDFGYDPNRFPYGQDFALNVINRYKAAADADTAYSLSAVMNPQMATNYRNNFNAGGWNGFLINTQYPQNNYLGFNMMATDQLARQLQGTTQNAAQKITTTLNQGMGFLSPQSCPASINPDYNNGTNEFQKPTFVYSVPLPPSVDCSSQTTAVKNCQNEDTIEGATPPDCSNLQTQLDNCNTQNQGIIDTWTQGEKTAQADFNEKNTCKKADGSNGLVNTTPGSVAANQIFTALGVDVSKSALGSMVEGSLSAILNTLVSHFLDQGLNALGSAINGSSSTTDSWSYQGNTLVTNTVAGTNPATGATLSVSPASVSIFPGNAVNNITVNGGTPPYNLLGTCDNGQAGSTPNVTRDVCMATTSGAGSWNIADPQFATVYGSDANITVIGVAAGNTSVIIQDSSVPAQTITLPIIITTTVPSIIPPATTVADPVGDCTLPGASQPTHSIKQSDCTNLNGNFSSTATTPNTSPLGACTVNGTPTQNITQDNCANTPVGAGTWSPYGTCTQNGSTTTNITKAACGTGIGIQWNAN